MAAPRPVLDRTDRPLRPELLSPVALHTFVAVAEHGSFTAAAATTGYTQSAVSRQVTALEQLCGVDLFVREPRGVRLSEAGQLLLPHARAVLGQLTSAARAVDTARRYRTQELRLGAFATAHSVLIPRALAGFRAAHPNAAVTLCEAGTDELLPMLDTGEIDIAVLSTLSDAPPDRPGQQPTLWLLEDPLLIAVPEDHRLAGRPGIGLADLADENWIVAEAPAARRRLEALCSRAGFTPRSSLRVDGWTARLGLVTAGLGVTLVPGIGALAVPAGVTLRKITAGRAHRTVYAALSAQARRTPLARSLVRELRETAAGVLGDLRTRMPSIEEDGVPA